MRNIFSVTTDNGCWWKGTLSIRYNFLTVLKVIGLLLTLFIIGFGLYWCGIGLWALLKLLWAGLCWLGSAVWTGICWFFSKWLWWLIAALVALLGWLLSKVNWKEIKLPEWKKSDKKHSWAWLWLLLLLLLLLCGLLWLPKSCSGSEPEDNIVATVSDTQFNDAFDWVVTTRAYLDGVQSGETKAEVALVGLKFVNGEPVTKRIFQGKTYEEAKEIIAQDWRSLVTRNVHVPLSERQLVVVTLFAMRNGKYGFEQSDLLKSINAGSFDVSTMAFHKANGEKRRLGNEGLQYLWMLKNLGVGNLSVEELLDYPMFSYKSVNLTEMYDYNREPVFNETLRTRLKSGAHKTPRQALDI